MVIKNIKNDNQFKRATEIKGVRLKTNTLRVVYMYNMHVRPVHVQMQNRIQQTEILPVYKGYNEGW